MNQIIWKFIIFLYRINLKYKIDKNEKEVKLFGEDFVKNNNDSFYLVINSKKYNISSLWKLDKNQDRKSSSNIILI